ncbi:CLUMA_CG021665, isoform A [Clunio marinus]|uniref:CLUMA_CG021665, isoform A n=1 Tax=Clunio marinus TaxID=568069 RepID=A0A1J1J846_9DIPT|nr:CLUMA_CG021665, isoform A [Clunio marinus]
MEVPSKKNKLNNLDPFQRIHSDLLELIFQHFINEDVLSVSTVSPLWFKLTEKSNKCMEKLNLKIVVPFSKGEEKKFENMSSDLKSLRLYENIYLHNIQNVVPEILQILQRGKWKEVYMSMRKIKNKKDLLEMMKLVELDVENFSMSYSFLENPNDILVEVQPEVKMSFPKLKNLDLSRNNGLLMNEIAFECKSLKVLRLDFDNETWKRNSENVRKILANNSELENLTLWRCQTHLAFKKESISLHKFKLKMFSYKNEFPMDRSCMFDFLESQAESIETLRLEDWCGIEILKLIFKMPRLKDLIVDLFDVELTIDWTKVNFNSNTSITKFEIESYSCNKSRLKIFNALFEAMPNLKFLITDCLDKVLLKAVGTHCRALEELEVQELRTQSIHDPQLFPNLKRFHCEDRIDMRVKQRINIKPVGQRSKFEQLILEAKPYFVT